MTGLTDADRRMVALVADHDGALRSALTTLARLGVKLRRADPDRAEGLVLQFESHPYYKAGQTLFDLLEWEDFLLDGDPPRADAATLLQFVRPIAQRLGFEIDALPDLADLPPLETGFYLYRDVVIGVLSLASDALSQVPPPPA